MIEYVDDFGRKTIIELISVAGHKSARLVIRRERQIVYESLNLGQLHELLALIELTINKIR